MLIFIKRLVFTVFFFVATGLFFAPQAQAINVSGTISTNTTWTTGDSPVVITGNVVVNNGVTLAIDPNVEVRFNCYCTFTVNGVLDINGTSGNEVAITHNSNTVANAYQGIIIGSAGEATIDYGEFSYGNAVLRVQGTATINDSTFDTNRVGISIEGGSDVTTNRNTFNSNTEAPIGLDADYGSVSFGSGGDADILGTSGDANANDAIVMGYGDQDHNNCPADTCQLIQHTFAGVSNIPYYIYRDTRWNGSNDTYQVDAGTIFKFRQASTVDLIIGSGATLNVNGTNGNEVIFTSISDDNFGGDTNNDSTGSSPHNNDNRSMVISTGTHDIEYAQFYYLRGGVEVIDSATLTVSNSLFEENTVGMRLGNGANVTTESNTFNTNEVGALTIDLDVGTLNFGSGGTADTMGTGGDLNGFQGFVIGYDDGGSTACPADVCQIPQRTFAGTANLPYLIYQRQTVSNDTLRIDAGVVIKMRNITNNGLGVTNGALDINGTSGNEVYITHESDDTVHGDDNNDGSASTASNYISGADIFMGSSGTSTIDYAVIKYMRMGSVAFNSHTLTVQDSTFENNDVGIRNESFSTLTTARNTFNSNSTGPLALDIHHGTTNFGSGGNADTLGSGGDANGFEGLVLAYLNGGVTSCPSDVCQISQYNFAGISNAPYLLYQRPNISTDTLRIDAGVVIKTRNITNNGLQISNSAVLDINGTSGEPVIITHESDDTVHGDDNNDGSATSPSEINGAEILVEDNTGNTIDYANISYYRVGTSVFDSASLTVQDSTYANNEVGIKVGRLASLTTNRNIFNSNEYVPIAVDFDHTSLSFGSGANADSLGTGSNENGFNALGTGYIDFNADDCPSNTCTISKQNFAGITNIPYISLGIVNMLNDAFVIDPGVIIKFEETANNDLVLTNNATLDINGTVDEPVYITSSRDDTIGGDINNDGSDTSPAVNAQFYFHLLSTGTVTVDYLKMSYADRGFFINSTSSITINDSDFANNNVGLYVQNFNSLVISRLNFLSNNTYGVQNNSGDTVTVDVSYWNAADGPDDDDPNGGACSIGNGISANGSGDAVNDTGSQPVDYCPFVTEQYLPNSTPTVNTGSITSLDNYYPGLESTFAAQYTDADGADNLDEMYVKIDHPTATDIEYYADEGATATGLTPTAVSGSEYVSSITYDRTVSGNTITVTWHVTLEWDWTESSDIEVGIKSIDDEASDSGYSTTTDANLVYENDLDFTGTITASGATQGSLTSGDPVQASENITWGGLRVVFQGTTVTYPNDSDFDVQLEDDDGTTWTDTVSSGANISIVSTADATADASDVHTFSIINIPSDGSDVSSDTLTIEVDDTAPAISSINVTPADSSATITWTTDEGADTQILYGLTSGALDFTTTRINTSPLVTSHSQSIASLAECTTYFYQVRSRDQVLYTTTSSEAEFTTTGCEGGATINASEESDIDASSGGTFTLTYDSREITLEVPADATSTDTTYQLKHLSTSDVMSSTGTPSGQLLVDNLTYNLTAYSDADSPVTSFDEPILITIAYLDEDVADLDESSLTIYRWDGVSWNALTDSTVDTANNEVTATTTAFSIFALFGEEAQEEPSGSSGSGSSSSSPGGDSGDKPTPKGCSALSPGGAPHLYAILPESSSSVTLYFTDATPPRTGYSVAYGTESGVYQYGAQKIGEQNARTITIDSLSANTDYYFKVQAINDCAPGDFSNELSIKTPPRFTTSVISTNFTYKTTPIKVEEIVKEEEVNLEAPVALEKADLDVEEGIVGEVEPEIKPEPAPVSEEKEEGLQEEESTGENTVKVNVLDEDGNPVVGAEVELHSTPRKTITDENGIALFENVEAGAHKLFIKYKDFIGEQALAIKEGVGPQLVEVQVNITLMKTVYWPFYLMLGVSIGLSGYIIYLQRKNRR